MAICAYIDANGDLISTTTQPSACTDLIVLESSEWAFFETLQTEFNTVVSLQDIVAIPEVAALQEAFMVGITLPVICYLTAWGYGVVINYFNPEHDRS
jgi:hypothetical protein